MPTISDVAKRAGVSPATVSRVMQGAKNVRPDTRERVQLAIDELGYVPSVAAQSLRSKRTRSLALVVSDITNPFWTTVARGVEDVAQRHGYSVLLCNTDENLAKQHQYLDFLISQQVDGVIIAPYDSDAHNLEKLRKRNIPTVLVDRRIRGWDLDSVLGDSVSGAMALVRHLIQLGHRRIAMLSGPTMTSTAKDRIVGYCMALTEAGIPVEPQLIKAGEYRDASGEVLIQELLDEGSRPTAVFAANNALAMGVISALGKRGARIPQDIALVSFDDLPNTSRLLPFLTVVAQPVYEMGVNAAQLLLSRLDSDVSLRPRHVVLPVRLIVRHSCGSQIDAHGGHCPLSLPIVPPAPVQSEMVRSLAPEIQERLARSVNGVVASILGEVVWTSSVDKPDAGRLVKALQHQEPDRVPYVEFQATSKRVYEYVLESELEVEPALAALGGVPVSPEEHVEFAGRLGMDAVACHFAWNSRSATVDTVEPPPSLAAQISYLERYLRATQGTQVGVIASFGGFFHPAFRAVGLPEDSQLLPGVRSQLEAQMDIILQRQGHVMRVICDRFADDLAAVRIDDEIADRSGLLLPLEVFRSLFMQRMERFVAPAKDHGKFMLVHTGGKLDQALPILHELGFDAVHPVDTGINDMFVLKELWAGRLALVGNIGADLLAKGSRDEIEEQVRVCCTRLGPGGGYVLSSSGTALDDVPPWAFVALAQAVHKYGRYGALGQEG